MASGASAASEILRPDPTCLAAIARVERGSDLPRGLLLAIGLVETGRPDPLTGRRLPWAWSYNAAGEGRNLESADAVVAAVAALQAQGVRSIDVGCMQVNLLHHPNAFASLREAFDPLANVRYAAGLLASLHASTGDWALAIGRYHSGRPANAEAYQRRVALEQLGVAWPSGTGSIALPMRRGCAGAGRAVLVFRGGDAAVGPEPRIVCGAAARRPQEGPAGVPVAELHRAPARRR